MNRKKRRATKAKTAKLPVEDQRVALQQRYGVLNAELGQITFSMAQHEERKNILITELANIATEFEALPAPSAEPVPKKESKSA